MPPKRRKKEQADGNRSKSLLDEVLKKATVHENIKKEPADENYQHALRNNDGDDDNIQFEDTVDPAREKHGSIKKKVITIDIMAREIHRLRTNLERYEQENELLKTDREAYRKANDALKTNLDQANKRTISLKTRTLPQSLLSKITERKNRR